MPSTCSRTRSGSAARSSALVTSNSTTGAGCGSFAATRCTSDSRPKPVSTTVAPSSWATFATDHAIEASVMTPVTSSRLPSSRPMSVPHPEAAVDRNHSTGDVRGLVSGEPPYDAGHLRRGRVPLQGDRRQVLGLLLRG